MRLEEANRGYVRIVLSKRNLLALLHKVDQEWSEKTIENHLPDPNPETPGYILVMVVAETDDVHYHHEGREESARGRAGSLHPETAAFVAVKNTATKLCNAVNPNGHCILSFGHDGECVMTHKIEEL